MELIHIQHLRGHGVLWVSWLCVLLEYSLNVFGRFQIEKLHHSFEFKHAHHPSVRALNLLYEVQDLHQQRRTDPLFAALYHQ